MGIRALSAVELTEYPRKGGGFPAAPLCDGCGVRYAFPRNSENFIHQGQLARLVPTAGIIGTNPLPKFADWKLAGDETGLKGGVSSAEGTDKERCISLSVGGAQVQSPLRPPSPADIP